MRHPKTWWGVRHVRWAVLWLRERYSFIGLDRNAKVFEYHRFAWERYMKSIWRGRA
jgi:hypothetical protein